MTFPRFTYPWRSTLAVSFALTLGAGSGLGYVALRPVAAEPLATAPVLTPPSTSVSVAQPLPTYEPPVRVSTPAGGDVPPQLVFPSSYTHVALVPVRSYVPPADFGSTPSGVPAAGPGAGAQAGGAGTSQSPEPGSQQQQDFQPPTPSPSAPPSQTPAPSPSPSPATPPSATPTPTPAPSPTPSPTPPPAAADPCAAAVTLGWTCLVDPEAEPAPADPAEAAATEAALLEKFPAEPDGATYELVVDLGERVVRVTGVDVSRAVVEEYLATVRVDFADAVLVAASATDEPAGE